MVVKDLARQRPCVALSTAEEVVILSDSAHWLIETKGREDLDIAHNDPAARIWCENATVLTGTSWNYVKVPQPEFSKLQPRNFAELAIAFGDLPTPL